MLEATSQATNEVYIARLRYRKYARIGATSGKLHGEWNKENHLQHVWGRRAGARRNAAKSALNSASVKEHSGEYSD